MYTVQRSKKKPPAKKLGTAAVAVFVVRTLSLASVLLSYGMLQLMHLSGCAPCRRCSIWRPSVLTLITAVGYCARRRSPRADTPLSMPVLI